MGDQSSGKVWERHPVVAFGFLTGPDGEACGGRRLARGEFLPGRLRQKDGRHRLEIRSQLQDQGRNRSSLHHTSAYRSRWSSDPSDLGSRPSHSSRCQYRQARVELWRIQSQ